MAKAQENPKAPGEEEIDKQEISDGEDAAAETNVGSKEKEDGSGARRDQQAQ